ncbi:hypothetical protein FF36_01902 [Frankia torreyi]|uniref:Phosphotransferase family protein n=1 Tax=Frankia torreyi TaxID=1856 RepID=A0A0D8BK05_9ACTN|nr:MULTISPECIES: hypothetical protein [Frankia]KJE23717.1 hypothetical protein FF36_01902 [Frankia torreyi]
MIEWDDLPGEARAAIIEQTGPVTSTADVGGGDGCDVAAVVTTPAVRMFVKGVHGGGVRARRLRAEYTNGRLAPGIAPTPRFVVDIDDWLFVGFDHAAGRSADLRPGSADLPAVAAAVDAIAALPAGELRPLELRWSGADWWDEIRALPAGTLDGWNAAAAAPLAAAAPRLVAGDRLTHTDLHGGQFLLDGPLVRVVDWARPAAAACWVDAAFLVIRLVGAGHEPADAERWAARLDCWTVAPDTLTAFACYVAGLWTLRATQTGGSAAAWRARSARRYAATRQGR